MYIYETTCKTNATQFPHTIKPPFLWNFASWQSQHSTSHHPSMVFDQSIWLLSSVLFTHSHVYIYTGQAAAARPMSALSSAQLSSAASSSGEQMETADTPAAGTGHSTRAGNEPSRSFTFTEKVPTTSACTFKNLCSIHKDHKDWVSNRLWLWTLCTSVQISRVLTMFRCSV